MYWVRSLGFWFTTAFLLSIASTLPEASAEITSNRAAAIFDLPQKLSVSDNAAGREGVVGDFFGVAMDIDGDIAVIGVSGDDLPGRPTTGSVYVARQMDDGWMLDQKLVSSDDDVLFFGDSVAISNQTILVGAPLTEIDGRTYQGAAYVFENENGVWVEKSRLIASDGASEDQFGQSVDIQGNKAVIGAFRADSAGLEASGAAYVFTRDAQGLWSDGQRIESESPNFQGNFGRSVAINGDWIYVGQSFGDKDAFLSEAGSVHVYAFNELDQVWAEEYVLAASDVKAGNRFGHALAVDGESVLIGAFKADVNPGDGRGAAYLFTYNSDAGIWGSEKLVADLPAAALEDACFGRAVAISGTRLLVGQYPTCDFGFGAGSVYAYKLDGGAWTYQQRIQHDPGNHYQFFGAAVALENESALIGAPGTVLGAVVEGGFVQGITHDGISWSLGDSFDTGTGQLGLRFGRSLGSDGVSLIVGSPETGEGSFYDDRGPGSAYVFREQGGQWVLEDKISAIDGNIGSQFGASVQIVGDVAVIGAPFTDVDDDGINQSQGVAYVFERRAGEWSQLQQLVLSDGAAFDYFGHDLAFDGESLIVSAYSAVEGDDFSRGAVYVFNQDPNDGLWKQTQKLTGVADRGLFGVAVELTEKYLIIGSPAADSDSTTNDNVGAIYLYQLNSADNWEMADTLRPSDSPGNGRFGFSIELEGDSLVVGAPRLSTCVGGCGSGSAYIFEYGQNGWEETSILQAGNPQSGDLFGSAVTIAGKKVLIGSIANSNEQYGLTAQGTVHAFMEIDGVWQAVGSQNAVDGHVGNRFGIALKLLGDTMYVGASEADDEDPLYGNMGNGAVYISSFRSSFLDLFSDRFERP